MRILTMLLAMMISCAISASDASISAFRAELEEIYELDQQFRTSESTYRGADRWSKQEAIDEANIPRVLRLIELHGWPRISEVGEKAAAAAFLVVQHADVELQKRFLPVLEARLQEKEAEPIWVALLTDRVRVNSGEPQLYGTQIRPNSKTGIVERLPIADAHLVNSRREQLGLGPLKPMPSAVGPTNIAGED